MEPRPLVRLDKWLWWARFFKSRALAAKVISGGHVRVDGQHALKPSRTIGAGDTLTFLQGERIRIVRIEAIGNRRGPATEARLLYTDLTPPEVKDEAPRNPRYEGKGRPTKRDRRNLDLKRSDLLE
ncbi:heat shock protein Hsp15 [Poseidonocella pacifica]|uniref:Heat shock protein Hsp15 n=1 Tax=Poseidonocella pacifica TaxID=871651 RepID=A0A1I0X562_9RHOB|nr:RNA-binding S4 domain-containing protein [Poseidonocella pacifica]SFA96192.1 heat shock protein Hsp15 [Poseidonocella pacifica]